MVDYGIRVIILGTVQGVGYREWASEKAEEFGLNGWIRNLSDGTVEAVFVGAKRVVQQMLEECEVGPHAARVDDVEQLQMDSDEMADVEEGFYMRSSV